MSLVTIRICGIILLTVPTIQYGGFFLLKILSGAQGKTLTDFQKSMFRAGHAHAGVLVILALIAQILTDNAALGTVAEWVVRDGFTAAAILVSGGFFASAAGKDRIKPNKYIFILYTGILVLAVSTIILGIGLIRNS
jgi:hypothetical protein